MTPFKPPPINASVASPCVRQCCLNAQDMCVGCGRYLAEITGWLNFTAAEKMTVVHNAQQRLKDAANKKPPG
ncbi:MAG TPA: DUF1289 domain-containing protein [Cellvibrionaceae bacterium]|nr:DUF1289 domain-containing protein [Cellvibrionaceae bacterium]HMY38413.1 DUF1289 domain-containing protein [Marinagarivorans sp.]HNG58285.1 DUF1289 domain-containing protein [Cellvibrionaceae bacterium]